MDGRESGSRRPEPPGGEPRREGLRSQEIRRYDSLPAGPSRAPFGGDASPGGGVRAGGDATPGDGHGPGDGRGPGGGARLGESATPASEASVYRLSQVLADYTRHIENLNIAEYVELVRNPRRMFLLNLLSGVGRGFGIAIGFTILGAIFLFFLQHLVMLNLPGIGGFIAELVKIVQERLRVP